MYQKGFFIMKILIDAYGGDYGASAIVDASLIALFKYNNIHIDIVGKREEIEGLLKERCYDESRLGIIDAATIITCDEAPVEALRTKRDSSLVVALDKLKTGEYAGLVSAGSTGAVLSGAVLKLGRLKGISRPALSPLLPTVKGGKVLLIDCGANMDSKAINLGHFALMGSEYMRVMEGIPQPRVALLNVGTEDTKGNELTKEAHKLLKELPINFVGNMEARDAMSGNYDVIVTDGFAGNILLKSIEGTLQAFMGVLKSGLKSSFRGKIGGLMIKKPLKSILKTYDYQAYGGSPLLGTKYIVVKAHGSAKTNSLVSSIEQVKEFAERDLLTKIGNVISVTEDILNEAQKKNEQQVD